MRAKDCIHCAQDYDVAYKAALRNSVYVSMHLNPMMYVYGVSKVDFDLQDKCISIGNVIKQ